MSSYLRSFDKDLSDLVAINSDAIVLIDEETGVEISWAKLDAMVIQVQNWLASIGVKPGEVVLSLLPNSVETLVLFLACMRYGYGYAPLPPSSSTREIEQTCGMVLPALAVILADADGRVAQVPNLPKTHVVQLDLGFAWAAKANPSSEVASALSGPSGKLYMSTSGSTGAPKLMVIDGNRLWSSGCAFVAENTFLGADACFYNIMPMSYLGGLFNLGLIPLACGGKIVVSPAFAGATVLRFWQDVMRYGVTILWLTPTMLRSLVRVVGPRWKSIPKANLKVSATFLGTAPIDLEEKETFENIFGIPVIENYGLSETTFISAEKLADRGSRVQRSVGQVLPWVDMRLTESKIEVRTPFTIDGYIGSDGKFLPVKLDEWFDTGDIGHMNDATLVLDGRIRDVIKKGGILIHLSEVDTLMRQYQHVIDVATVDIPHAFYGEDYVLFVVFDEEFTASESEGLDGVRAYLTNNLVQTKWPAHVIPIKAIPRTRSGKVAKDELRKLGSE